MFARIVEFIPDFEKKEELIKTLRNQVLPILKKQSGFLEILPLFPENEAGKVVSISLWTEKRDAERFERETYPRVHEILKPYLNTPGQLQALQGGNHARGTFRGSPDGMK